MAKRKSAIKNGNGANLDCEEKLRAVDDNLRGHIDTAKHKHVVLGLIFIKNIPNAFEERHAALKDDKHATPEDRDEYTAENVFWVPKPAHSLTIRCPEVA